MNFNELMSDSNNLVVSWSIIFVPLPGRNMLKCDISMSLQDIACMSRAKLIPPVSSQQVCSGVEGKFFLSLRENNRAITS